MDYTIVHTEGEVQKVIAALKDRNIEGMYVADKAAALQKIKELIPAGASIHNGSSRTLEEIGYVDYLKAGQHGWNNIHATILAEPDPVKQRALRKQATIADYYLGSVHAITEAGEILIASNTGSQLPNIVYGSDNVILVVGAQKIVPTLADAHERLEKHVVPLEEANMQQKYKVHTNLSKLFTYLYEHPMTGRKVTVLFVGEKLGF